MSSSRNSQNLLVNVFRPTYVYDGSSFSSAVVASNVKSIDVDTVRAGIVELGDAGGNVYLGKNAGIVYAASNSNSNNSAFGVNAAAGIRNVKNSVFIGSGAGQGLIDACNTVVIGAGSTISGTNNVVVGNNDFITGSNNFILANDVTLTGSYKVNIGNLITGDVSANTLTFQTGITVSGDTITTGKVGIKYPNPVRELDVSGSIYATRYFYAQDGSQNAPAYTFLSDPSTGIFRDICGSLGFSKGGNFSMKLDPCGNVIYNNLVVNGTLACATFDASGIAANNLAIPGYIRNNDITFVMDISQGNFQFTGTGQSRVAGVTFRDSSINAANGIVGTGFALSDHLDISSIYYSGLISNLSSANKNTIGGVVLQHSNVLTGTGTVSVPSHAFSNDASLGLYRVGTSTLGFTSAGVNRMTISNANVGIGTIAPGASLTVIGDISATTGISGSNITTNSSSSNSVGGVLLSNGVTQVSNGIVGAPSYSFANETGLGMYRLSTSALTFASAGANRMTISGGLVGIGTTAPTTALTVVGDVSTANLSYTGAITNSTTNTSNLIGGVTLSNTNITYAGAISNTVASSSNSIGGVVLSNTNITYAGAISNTVASSSNSIGGVTLSNTNITYAGAISNTVASSSNSIGGVTLSNTNITYAGAISNTVASSSNSIGGVTLSNSNVLTGSGSVSIPSHSFSTDPSLGLYRITANTLGIASAGSNSVTISGDKVGINATSMVTRFQVNPTVAVAAVKTYDSSAAMIVQPKPSSSTVLNDPTPVLYLGREGTGAQAYGSLATMSLCRWENNSVNSRTRMDIALTHDAYNDVSVMSIRSDGRVGIGTTAPATILNVEDSSGSMRFSGTSGSYGKIEILGPSIPNPNPGSQIVNSELSFCAAGNTGFNNCIRSINLGGGAYADCNRMGFFTYPASGDSTLRERLTIMPSGNIGIGTTAPSATLEVSGGLPLILNRVVAGQNNFITLLNSSSARWGIGVANADTGSGNGGSDFNLISYTDAGSLNATPFVVKRSNGFVGIGTSNPVAPLDVITGAAVVGRLGNMTVNTDVSMCVEGSANIGMYTLKGTNNNFGGISFKTLSNATLAERMRIDANTGRIGIGITAPVGTLDVNGDICGANMSLTGRITTGSANSNVVGGVLMSNGFLRPGAGNEGSPSIAFLTDVSSGIFSGGADIVNFVTAGRNRMTVFGSNIGIGSRTPNAILDVCGGVIKIQNRASNLGGTNYLSLFDISTTSNGVARIALALNNPAVGGNVGNDFAINTYDDAGTYIATPFSVTRANGYVGMGTTTPATQLDVYGQGTGNTTVLRISSGFGGSGNSNNIARLRLAHRVATGADLSYDIMANEVATANNYGLTFGGYGNEGVIRMDMGNRRLGINTVAPSFTLDVCGTIRGSSNIVSAGTATYSMGATWNSISASTYTDIMSLSFTPKQSGNVTLIVTGKMEVQMVGTGGDDTGNFRLTDGVPNELAFNTIYTAIGSNNVYQNLMWNPLMYVGTFSGAQTFKLQYQAGGSASFQVRRGVITVYEVSLT